ncbi:FCD domain-containing protein [Ensifer sp. ZNC0028]|uniref:FCD domain-containing protein n=1 Tax=Ensifer sp. ZNC0028 TaxID=1339236 RepID=UPI000A83F643|nr:FCD domain-containing protein [Ensifer sp. ZNC0028]
MKREAALPSVEMRRLLDDHEAILDAIQSGDEEQARAAMRDHLKNSQTRYRSMLRTLR